MTSLRLNNFLQSYLFKFSVIAVLNTVVELLILNILLFLFPDSVSPLSFFFIKTVSFVCAVLHSYLWHTHWTFKSGSKKLTYHLKTFSHFGIINIFALTINISTATLIFSLQHEHVQSVLILSNLASLGGSLAATMINARGYKTLFSKRVRE